jgi:tyrosyl-tRNA synthetase
MRADEKAKLKPDINRLLSRGVAEIIVEEELLKLLRSGKKLRLKEGFDPSFPDIHLGHVVSLRKLRQFQEIGHQVVLIVADWTAQIGDPSGVSVTRPMLSAEQVRANAETYLQQFFKVVDKDRTEVRWQSEWFEKFTLTEVIRLTSQFTVAQLLARDDFSARYNAGRPIAVTEFLYPLLQAYDSVAIEADVEFGGTDQKFNLLLGREYQTMMGQRPQQCFMTTLLVGTDGSQKMSKSLGNYIGVAEPPDEIYGKTMSIRDDLILQYFELVTDVPDKELKEFRDALASNAINPMELKKRLAWELVTELYDQKTANKAEESFTKVFQKRESPEEIKEVKVSFKDFVEFVHARLTPAIRGSASVPAGINISRLLVELKLAKSRSEANRLIAQGSVSIDGKKISNNLATLKNGSIIKVGKRRFAKVTNTDK